MDETKHPNLIRDSSVVIDFHPILFFFRCQLISMRSSTNPMIKNTPKVWLMSVDTVVISGRFDPLAIPVTPFNLSPQPSTLLTPLPIHCNNPMTYFLLLFGV